MNHEHPAEAETSPVSCNRLLPAPPQGCQQAQARERASFALPGAATTAPSEARRCAVATLRKWKVPQECTERVELIVSELATNAVKHTASLRIRLEIELFTDAVTVSVRDRGPRPATPIRPRSAADQYAVSGRGLSIVETLSVKWGAHPTSGRGSIVWATVAVAA